MPATDYMPKVGETIFMSTGRCQPDLITVTGIQGDVMTFKTKHGPEETASIKDRTFYPDVPADTSYIYVITFHDDFGHELPVSEWFFSVDEAFGFIDAKPDDEDGYGVEVQRV